jgi:hypothetical protein
MFYLEIKEDICWRMVFIMGNYGEIFTWFLMVGSNLLLTLELILVYILDIY